MTELAHFNWARLRHDWDDPRVSEFVNNILRVNRLAERSDGFRWRLQDDAMEVAQLDPEGVFLGAPRIASTLSVWSDVPRFAHFVQQTVHARFMQKAGDWFEPHAGPSHALWHVAVGYRPGMAEAAEKIEELRANGPSAGVFDLTYARHEGWYSATR